MKALHFGAGNIGKGFIGYLLNKTGYEVCFVDVNQQMVDSFNETNRYVFELLDDSQTEIAVSPVSALNSLTQEEQVIEAIAKADLITTSVGVQNLSRIAPVLSKGLLKRQRENKNKIDILANENAINASSTLKQEIAQLVSASEMEEINAFAGFPNTAIDRLSLSKTTDDGEIALVEPFYEWVINKSEMTNLDLPSIQDALYVEDLKPYIERKLYILNMGHATTAYIGFLANEATIQSALEKPAIEQFVRETLEEASHYIHHTFGITHEELHLFIEKILKRFQNKNISDDVFRVGRSPIRKLSFNERLTQPARELAELGLPVGHLAIAVAAAFLFDNPQDEESAALQAYIQENGIEKAIPHFTQIENQQLVKRISENYNRLKNSSADELLAVLQEAGKEN
ncbi:mannitol-1-phosphate 5-dehydrogenase [Planococcus sp. YIM B11945]|uniref:mannitol-1-phosphate 5-dehydrogenase n=1 Tax=Planococcus sp. YIM B11945 TaxID=3435410 RepID=UPI003D7EE830